jgi:DNA mismatch repair protein MutS
VQTATPMMQQYHDAKAAAGDALLLFRMGDFYELFFEDAKTAARVLGLSLTSRDKGENPVPMAGFPYHQLDPYLAKIIAAGHRAAICEQVEDPKKAKGLVKREVTRIVTPGTLTDDSLLDPATSNFLAAIAHPTTISRSTPPLAGLAWIDLSTGNFSAASFSLEALPDELARIRPTEILISDESSPLAPSLQNPVPGAAVTRRPAWTFGHVAAVESLAKHFGTRTLEGLGFSAEPAAADAAALRAAGAILDYLLETQKASLAHVDRLSPYSVDDCLAIDPAARRSLELTETIRDNRRAGSLLGSIDRTVTSLGARLLADWLAAPLTSVAAINARLDGVAELVADATLTGSLRESLQEIYDLQRLLSRVATGRASPRDVSFIGRTLARLPKVKAKLTGRASALLTDLESRLDLCADIRGPLERALVDDCPLTTRDGNFIRPGFHAGLDEFRELMAGGKQWMAEYQAAECQRTGIPNIKVGFNSVFGYYLEITHAQRDKVPADYIRKQTIKNAERFITPQLKEYEEKVLTAEERANDLECELFTQLRDLVGSAAPRLQATAAALAEIDVLASLADLARSRNYCRPTVVAEPILEIEAGRHPVLDITEPEGTFVPNDLVCAAGKNGTGDSGLGTIDVGSSPAPSPQPPASLLLITGPNMAGKSTYIRQAALLAIMAQMGSFIPARRATVGVADRIFARIGASDELARGQSTFMVEMTETARILNTATPRSLVILDEIGRGTSTYDGLSLAWSIVEHIHEQIGCRTLFATHYHELTDLADQLAGAANFNVAVKEWQDQVVFLHQIVPGAADKSYGIHVAQLAGVPRSVNDRAKEVLHWLETQHNANTSAGGLAPETSRPPAPNGHRDHWQLTLFGGDDHPLLDEIRAANLDDLTPREALELLHDWQERLAHERSTANLPR